MQRILPQFLCQCLLIGFTVAHSRRRQETRGKISGTVRDRAGVVPGAAIKITNTDTNVSQNLTTNDSGYFEAPLLNPGTYEVTVQMPGYKAVVRDGITLGVGEQVTLPFTLEVGQINEQVVVKAEAPLLDTTSLSSAANFDTRLVESLPMFSNMPITLSRFAPGTNVNDQQTQVSQGYVDNTSLSAGSGLGLPLGGTQPAPPSFGGNNYTLDGANNNGSSRRIAASPNSDMIQEMRVESSNFDAAVGHGLGLQISMMTRAGTNKQRGTVNYQYWTNKFNALTAQQKLTFDDRAKERVREGPLAQPVADRRRPGAHPRPRRRPQQAVLLRQLLVRERRDPRQDPGGDHRPGEREPPAGRFLRSAEAARTRRITRSTIR